MTSQIAEYDVLAMQSYDFLDEDAPNVSMDDLKVNNTAPVVTGLPATPMQNHRAS